MSLSRNVDPADQQMSIANQDPPSIPVGVQQPRASQDYRGNQQLVQWLSVQADHMAGSLQQNVRTLMVRVSSPMPSDSRHQDEVARLRAQLQHAKKLGQLTCRVENVPHFLFFCFGLLRLGQGFRRRLELVSASLRYQGRSCAVIFS